MFVACHPLAPSGAAAARPATGAGLGAIVLGIALSTGQTHAAPPVTETVADGTYATDGSGKRSNWLIGAYKSVSQGAPNNSADPGGSVDLGVTGGNFTVTIGSNPQNVPFLSGGGPGASWGSGLLAASLGADGTYFGPEGAGKDSFRDGGAGGRVNLTVGGLRPVEIRLDSTTLPAVTGGLTLSGVTALSQGGINSSRYEFGLFTGGNYYYSKSGNAGAVTVDFLGRILAEGSYASAAGSLIAQEIGISALSRGGGFQCHNSDCEKDYKQGFNSETPGTGGPVTVTLQGGSEIRLQQGSAVGIYALSANGGIVSVDEGAGFKVNTSALLAGTVTVDVKANARISVGNEAALASAGILAISAGSELLLPLSYQCRNCLTPSSSFPYVNSGGSGVGSNVTVRNAGDIEAEGSLAIGIAALSLGGEATVGALGVTPGVYHASKKSPATQNTLGAVSVSNEGRIATRGNSAHGIVAASLGSGGLLYAALQGNEALREEIAKSCDIENAAVGQLPYCNGVETGVVLGNLEGTSAVNGGRVSVTNRGTITTGVAGAEEGSEHAMGIFAQSIGGGGGNGSGGWLFWSGDSAGAGGNGGAVDVANSGNISTYGNFATGMLAQSVGGGGGVGGSTNFLPWVAVGGRGGAGGSAGNVTLTLDSAGTIITQGEFAQGVLAQSVGGGGGVGGAANGYGESLSVSVGGVGGSGGNGSAVSVTAAGNNDVAWNSVNRSLVPTGLDIITDGDHANGIVAQSIGGGGGVGGHANSFSASAIFNLNLSFGGRGGAGGKGGTVDVFSDLDILSNGDDAIGILAQSIGGGGGTGGNAYSNSITLELPCEGEPCIPNLTYTGAFGGKGGVGNTASAVNVYNGGLVATAGEGALGILAQSIGGGGGSGGDSTAISRAIPLKFKSAKDGVTLAINVTTAIGGAGGSGGDAGQVIVHNASRGGLRGGVIRTEGDRGAGLVAQSIGGGGGNGGTGDAAHYTDSFAEVIQDFVVKPPPEGEGSVKIFAIDITAAVGGSGGAGGNGGYVEVYNGEQTRTASGFAITPGTIWTSGGAAPGMLAQSIGGGGGMGGEGAVNALGGRITLNLGVGGSGGAAGNGANVYALNPAGASIRTGDVVRAEASEEETSAGVSPFVAVTTGGSSVGILAQSIGGGGGAGGNADATSALEKCEEGPACLSSASVAVTWAGFLKNAYEAKKNNQLSELFELAANMDVSVGGKGGAAGNGAAVLVDNGGSVETYGEQAHGIQAQSIGGGGGNGGAVEAASASWQSEAVALPGLGEVTLGLSVGGAGGAAGNGGTVTVNSYSGAEIITHGYGGNGIFAQSIGGGGGYGGNASANSEGFIYIGGSVQGNQGATGRGDAVTVSSAGRIETWGDDANGILAQSIGGGGGSGVVGCTNGAGWKWTGGALKWGGASPCSGNNESEDGKESKSAEWGSVIDISANMGGGRSATTDTGDDGGVVSIALANTLTTYGSRSMGVVAQSIGGGGGFFSGDASAFSEATVAPNAGQSHSHGRAVSVDLQTGARIATFGAGAWGVLAQSIGGSGGFVGDSSLSLGLLVSNTVNTVCCGKYSTGADGGDITVNLAAGTSITTQGRNAHGIVAQSIGGGGGIAAGGDNNPDALVYAGNPLASAWRGADAAGSIEWTGKGGRISVAVAQNATVDVRGPGSIGILAQSSGDRNYQSQIDITVAGSVIGGSGYNNAGNLNQLALTGQLGTLDAAAIMVSGGDAVGNRAAGTPPNQVTVTQTGSVRGRDQYQNAIVSMNGRTNVLNYGYINGSIKLGSSATDPNLGVFTNYGTWVAGVSNLFSNNSVQNYGVVQIIQPTVVQGSFKHYAGGELRFQLDPAVHLSQPALTVTGLARLEGRITPVLDKLLPGELRLLKAGSLVSSARIDNPLLFDWSQRVTPDGELRLAAQADFRPAGMTLGTNPQAVAAYLERAWLGADPYLAGHFAYMLRMDSQAQHAGMLDALGAPELLHQHSAALQAIPNLLGEAIDCPVAGTADVLVKDDSCAWVSVGKSWGRYSGDDTPVSDIDGDLLSMGVQGEVSPGWFLSGVLGRLKDDAAAGTVHSTGKTDIGSIGLKRQAGNWNFGVSLAYGSGSYDSVRRFALPVVAQSSSAPEALLSSDSDMDIRALRTRMGYAFSFGKAYLRPMLELDVVQARTSGFEERAGAHLFRLRAAAHSSTDVVVTPHVEFGGERAIGDKLLLRGYVDVGVRLAPDADREIDLQIAGANPASDYFRSRIDVPLATGLLKLGMQVYGDDALDLRLEYRLQANDDFRNQTATARAAWRW